jgi:hypothetical protein
MFLCKYCQEQFDDRDLAYTVILEAREHFPAAELFLNKFCCLSHLQTFLTHISNQSQTYVLTKITPTGNKRFDAATPLDLLLLVGSSKAS